MPQQELNLLQLATATVAQFRAGSPQVMRRNHRETAVAVSSAFPISFSEVPSLSYSLQLRNSLFAS